MIHRAHLLGPALLAAAWLLLAVDSASQPEQDAVSLGHANGGSLLNGVRLPDQGTGYRSVPSRPDMDYKFGTEELLAAIVKVGADVERQAPGATLIVGDLSVPGGGPTSRHESHQAGRDVDLLFYSLDSAGKIIRPRGVSYDGEGRVIQRGASPEPAQARFFDTRRNWLVLRSLIENVDAHLQRVLVSEPLRALLLDHARANNEPAWVIERASEIMCDSWSPHDDHFHVRVYCTAADYRRGCRDEYPLYPWRRTELAAQKIFNPELEEDPFRSRPRAKRWIEASGTGRQWCP